MTVSERMFAVIDSKNLVTADLCKILGVGTSQTSSWKSRNTDPPAKYLMQIANFLGVSIEYLLTGVDTSAKLSPLETDMVAMFRELTSEQKHEFVGELKGYLRAVKPLTQDKAE